MKFLIEQESTLNRDRRQEQARKDLESLSNYSQYLRQGQFEYIKKLSNINNEKLRSQYLNYLNNLKISFSEDTIKLINKLQDNKQINIYDENSFINDPKFFINEDDVDQRNKIKTYVYFNNPSNLKQWGFKSSQDALQNLKDEKGNWKPYREIASWLEEVNSKYGEGSADVIDSRLVQRAFDVLEGMGVKEKEARQLIAKLTPILNPDVTDEEIAREILKLRAR